RCDDDALLVGLELFTTAEAGHDGIGRLVDDLVEDRRVVGHRLVGAHLDGLALLDGADRVLLGDVNDLVTEDACKLRLVAHQRERAARDVHVAARRGQRVDAVGVEHDELPGKLRPLAVLRQHVADERHVLVDRRILDDAVALPNLLADGCADLLLVLVGDLQIVELLRFLQHGADLTSRPGGRTETAGRPDAQYRNQARDDGNRLVTPRRPLATPRNPPQPCETHPAHIYDSCPFPGPSTVFSLSAAGASGL